MMTFKSSTRKGSKKIFIIHIYCKTKTKNKQKNKMNQLPYRNLKINDN